MSDAKLELPENLKGTPPPKTDNFPPIGMGPAVWGPIFWKTMHIVTIGYPSFPTEDEQKAAVDFFESLQFMIPCPICKEHYKMNLQKLPIKDAVVDKQHLIRWLFNMHNTINAQLGKSEITWREFVFSIVDLSVMQKFSFQEAAEAQRGRSFLDTQSLLFLIAGIGIGVGGYMVYKHYSK